MSHSLLFHFARALAVLLIVGIPTLTHAAFTYSIDVTGDGVLGAGVITLPTDIGGDATGVDLDLNVTMFGNAVTFTEVNISDIQWEGANPGDSTPLVFNPLSLLIFGPPLLGLSDNGGGVGDAVCSDAGSGCGGGEAAAAVVAWSYTAQDGQIPREVPEPSTMVVLLAGFGAISVRRVLGRTS